MGAAGEIAVALALSVFLAAGGRAGEATGDWSEPVKGLRCRVVLDQDSHKVGERTKIRLQLENVSKAPVTYAVCYSPLDNWQDTTSLSVRHSAPDGQMARIRLRDLYPFRRMSPGPRADSWRVLKGGETADYDLARTFYYGADVGPRPGRYRIVGVYHSRYGGRDGQAWTGVLQSPPVELTVTAPDPLGDREKVERDIRALLGEERARLGERPLSQFLHHTLWGSYQGRTERLVQRLVNLLTNPEADRSPKFHEGLLKATAHKLPEVRALAAYCWRRLALVKANAAWRAAIDARFTRELGARVRDGSAVCSAPYFRDRGWGWEYARQMATRWKGRAALGISLRLEPLPGPGGPAGGPFDCRALLTNGGDKEREVVVGCPRGITRPLRIAVITPDGQVTGPRLKPPDGWLGWGRPTKRLVKPGETVELQTGFASDAMAPWNMTQTGQHVVIGCYTLSVVEGGKTTGRFIRSPPLIVQVTEP